MIDSNNYLNSPETIYSISKEFFSLGKMELEKSIDILKTHGRNLDLYLPPMVASGATFSFSVELAFKGLYLYHNDEAITGHDLYQLFIKLPRETKHALYNKQRIEKYQNYLLTSFGINVEKNKSRTKGYYVWPSSLEQCLKTHKDSFHNMRYLFQRVDKNIIDYNFNFMANLTHNTLLVLFETLDNLYIPTELYTRFPVEKYTSLAACKCMLIWVYNAWILMPPKT